ncbi:kinase-like domain-containing protein [Lentinula boryana]|uniref:Kinase-like domain-containing protein n=1 Tax=Lentinula boryana TaxID=40481 RepID=A0ABQ8Q1C0_9AGAR|nr:kinase-like domain-containing protein [Lentinula boryana]
MNASLEVAMNSEFFAPITRYLKSGENDRNIQNSFGEDSWIWKLAVKAEDTPDPLSYGPKSDIAWWLGKYPRLLGEVYSKGSNDDRARLLVQGAFCTRLANLLLDEKKLSKEFINVLLYVDQDFKADLYLFFQNNPEKTNDRVFYSSQKFNLKERSSDGKAFLRELYNLTDLMRQGDAILTILREEPTEFTGLVRRRFKQTFSRKTKTNKPSNTDDASRHVEKGKNSGNSALEERGYELLPVRLCDPMFKPPPHVYRVRQRTDIERHVYIAKKQARKSKELEIIRALNEKRPPCKNIIQLIDTVETSDLTYIILPELRSVDEQVYIGGGHLRGHFVNLARDLAHGVVFMHNSGIAHLDIKPKNLVYDKDLRLQIIDFDTSVFAKDEEFLVRGYIGSEWWMAPEIGKEEDDEEDRPWYSPIRADRYSCGRVFEAFAKCQRRSDGGLRVFAEKLMDPNPQLRPKLTEWLAVEPELMTGSDEKSGRARSEDKTLVREVWSSESTKGMQRSHKRFRFEAGL